MEVDDKERERNGNDKTFINKLLGEMKNQFNKTEKKQDSILENSTPPNDEVINLNSSLPIENNIQSVEINTNSTTELEKVDSDKNDNFHDQESKTVVKQENLEVKPESEAKVSDTMDIEETCSSIKEEPENQEENDEKPRIVLTFRKPTTNDSFKSKNKDESVNSGRRTLRAKLQIVEDNVILKRSPRRRSRDCNESVLQSAIARKEKSYNEASKPQRLTRQLKATPKILENLANAALKLEKNRTDKKSVKSGEKHKIIDNDSDNDFGNLDETIQSESDVDNEKNHKRHKHKHHTKNSKHISKKIKHNQIETRDSDSDQSGVQDVKEVEKYNSTFSDNKNKCSKNRSSIEEKSCRRSHRLSSKMKDEMISLDDSGEILEPDTAEQDSFYPADPECSSVEAQLIASRLCLCSHKTQVYVSAANDDIVHCTAIDSIGDRLVGCNSVVDGDEIPMLRPSSRVPYIILCEVHLNRMLRHNCCPKCGLFCTQGRFAQCEAKHQYHRECQISVGDSECCPHCGLSTPEYDVFVTMHSSKKPIFLPTQKPQYPSAKMSFHPKKIKKEDTESQNRTSPIISPSSIYSNLVQTATNNEKYDIDTLFQAIKEGDHEKLALILGSNSVSLNTPLEDFDGGTVLHYAALNGMLSIIHMLVVAGAELDVLDKEQNTALVCAILAFKNNIVKYLIKAGASITLKGTDGMTALHIAAKSGNLAACELLLDASSGKKDYVDTADDGGWTPLVWACEHGHFEVVKYLLFKDADPLLRDVEQNVALHWAAFSGSADIAELLLNNKSDVNAINAHGDSPMHIGARQNMYSCILILLARGANVNVVNKAGETPLDCTKPNSDCYTAISLNVHLQALISPERKSHRTILTNDISRGREANPIQCINSIDDEQKPTDFVYISENCITSDLINIDRKISTMNSCLCEEKCTSFNCLCCNHSLRCWYDEEGKLLADFNYSDPPMIFECNQLCNCNAITCNNRIVQHGLTQRFQLFKTETKGWGIRTLRNIAKGTYVCEYIGEVIADTEADRREDDSYIFDLDNKDSESFCIDAKQYGNFTRFINHSCEPNLIPIRVFIEHHDLRFPRIAFFANRDITAEEELSFDYGERFWIVKYKSFTCDCGSLNCKYSEETIVTTVENYNKKLQEEIV
ncbi:hypothetical protein ILUMI_00894 [Ignelater luminosus]|uniref:Histone-lysine N-methyltransferase EHMT2 n=1 Tax=Ignelater luminosus TaxID=2038154 RepID=A0A8K0DGC5_IGNLU|nr:hypothetical protein ILUMI_00894 [Ignelater luminosus]